MEMKLVVYNTMGQEITILVNKELEPGVYEINWDGSEFASGIYFYKLNGDNYSETKRMVLIK